MDGRMRGLRPLIGSLLDAVGVFDRVQRMFHPAMTPRHGEVLHRKARELLGARQEFFSRVPGLSSGEAEDAVIRAVDLVVESARIFRSYDDMQTGVFAAMRAMRKICRAKEALFDQRGRVAKIDNFFREAPRDRAETADNDLEKRERLVHTGMENDPYARQVERVSEHHCADTNRVLLTGLSDGATFALRCAMLPSAPFSAFAPVSGVLPPNEVFGAAGRRIYWIHGARDWMFPPERARQGSSRLHGAGAEVTLKVLDNLAHAHPFEENAGSLAWFDPGLSLPEAWQVLPAFSFF